MPVCILISLGTEIELSLDDIVLDGNIPPLPLKAHNPLTRVGKNHDLKKNKKSDFLI